ncbi:MAG: hypothetical protein V3W14_10175 [Candidatus Neomarinimicrobiota bacterium]
MTGSRCRALLVLLAVLAARPLIAQIDEEELPTDTLKTQSHIWVGRLVPILRDTPKKGILYLHWDEWGHSDMAATVSNPFVPTDLMIGAARLDGGLGQPVLSAVIPSSMTPAGFPIVSSTPSPPGPNPLGDVISFDVLPMQDTTRSPQSYFHWDQGDYSYSNTEVGGAASLDETRSLVLAGRGLNHAGQYGLSGPGRGTRAGENVLQDYVIDYRNRASQYADWSYTLLFQKERTGIAGILADAWTSDMRSSATWAHGFTFNYHRPRVNALINWAATTSVLATRRFGAPADSLNRRSVTSWLTGGASYQLPSERALRVYLRHKQRRITDRWLVEDTTLVQVDTLVIVDTLFITRGLGFKQVSADQIGVGLAGGNRKLAWYAGLAAADGNIFPEGHLRLALATGSLQLRREVTAFLDLPHRDRRVTLDDTPWLPGPAVIRKWEAAYGIAGRWGTASAAVAHLATGEPNTRQAVTGGLNFDWTVWPDVLLIRTALTALISPDSLLPPRMNAGVDLHFTFPLKNLRARPFVYFGAMVIDNNFSRWYDPLYADTAPLEPPVSDPVSISAWITGAIGVKVKGFELRVAIFNMTGVTLQNAPPGALGVQYIPGAPLKHYSLSWIFPPQKAGSGPDVSQRGQER